MCQHTCAGKPSVFLFLKLTGLLIKGESDGKGSEKRWLGKIVVSCHQQQWQWHLKSHPLSHKNRWHQKHHVHSQASWAHLWALRETWEKNWKTEVSTIRHTALLGESFSWKQLSDFRWESAAFLNDLSQERILHKRTIYSSRKIWFIFFFVSGQHKILNMYSINSNECRKNCILYIRVNLYCLNK